MYRLHNLYFVVLVTFVFCIFLYIFNILYYPFPRRQHYYPVLPVNFETVCWFAVSAALKNAYLRSGSADLPVGAAVAPRAVV